MIDELPTVEGPVTEDDVRALMAELGVTGCDSTGREPVKLKELMPFLLDYQNLIAERERALEEWLERVPADVRQPSS